MFGHIKLIIIAFALFGLLMLFHNIKESKKQDQGSENRKDKKDE